MRPLVSGISADMMRAANQMVDLGGVGVAGAAAWLADRITRLETPSRYTNSVGNANES